VLFLDEPTTGLDPHSRNGVWEMVAELTQEGTTVVLTTQYLEEADRLAARVAVIDGGLVIANDTPAALKQRLGATVIELGFANIAQAREARGLVDGADGSSAEVEGNALRITSDDGARALIEILRVLERGALVPSALTVREPSLDDVFLALTGRHAESADPPDLTVEGAA